MQFFEEKKI